MQSSVTILNPRTVEFYHSHPHLKPEVVNEYVIDMLQACLQINNNTNDIKLQPEPDLKILPVYTNKLDTSMNYESNLENILNKLNPMLEVVKNHDTSIICDFIIKKEEYPHLFIENKVLDGNVLSATTKLFTETCKQHKANGLFISQTSGIVGKKNMEIELVDDNVIIYISNTNNNEDKIQIALDIIDKLYDKNKSINKNYTVVDTITISNDTLDEIKTIDRK